MPGDLEGNRAGCAHNVAVVAADMGYGHLRAAYSLADALGTEVLSGDRPPVASASDTRLWGTVRRSYGWLSRASQSDLVGPPLRGLLSWVTSIPPLYDDRDQTSPTLSVRMLERLVRRGFGDELVKSLRATGSTLLTTFYAHALVASHHGLERVICVITDSDINRIWAPRNAPGAAIHYCVPSGRAGRRLRAFGVPKERIHLTGFPLPGELLGGPGLEPLRADLAARIMRLDPKGAFRDEAREELEHFLGPLPASQAGVAPLLVFAVGGTGAQVRLVREFLPSLAPIVKQGRLRLALVAGVREDAAQRLRRWCADASLAGSVEILHETSFPAYYRRFNDLLRRADILWTKPSELTFYGALGIPLVFSRPMGVHERMNQRWARERGCGLKQASPRHAWGWLDEWLREGTLASAGWSGYTRLPKFGTQRICDLVDRVSAL